MVNNFDIVKVLHQATKGLLPNLLLTLSERKRTNQFLFPLNAVGFQQGEQMLNNTLRFA